MCPLIVISFSLSAALTEDGRVKLLMPTNNKEKESEFLSLCWMHASNNGGILWPKINIQNKGRKSRKKECRKIAQGSQYGTGYETTQRAGRFRWLRIRWFNDQPGSLPAPLQGRHTKCTHSNSAWFQHRGFCTVSLIIFNTNSVWVFNGQR